MTIPGGLGALGDLQRQPQEVGTFSGARNTGKNLNMLGGRNLINEGQVDNLSNGNNLGIISDYRTTSNHVSANAYGQHDRAQLNANASNNMSVRDRDRDILSQNNVSHSALVNSGNTAILGHSNGLNSFKLNSNNNNQGNGPATMGGAYGAVGTNHGLLGPSEQERGRSV